MIVLVTDTLHMHIPELPFQPDEGTEVEVLSEDSNNSVVYEIQVSGESYIIKDILPNSFTLENIPGETLQEKAENIQLFFTVMKDHIGKRAWDTSFLLAKDRDNQLCVRVVQKKIDGLTLAEYEADGIDSESAAALKQIKDEVRAQLERAFADERLSHADFSETKQWVKTDALFEKNIFITEEGDVYLIDLI